MTFSESAERLLNYLSGIIQNGKEIAGVGIKEQMLTAIETHEKMIAEKTRAELLSKLEEATELLKDVKELGCIYEHDQPTCDWCERAEKFLEGMK